MGRTVCTQWYLLDSAGDAWRPAGDIQRHSTQFGTSNDTSWILLETPGDSLEPSQDIYRCSLHPMIPPGFCWRHLETCWRCPETYHKVQYIQWYLLDSTGDTWRRAGAFTRHTSMFATSSDTSWILLEPRGDLLETSRDIPWRSWPPMIPPAFCWRHWRAAGDVQRHTTRFVTSNDTSWILLETPGDLLETSRDIPQGWWHPTIHPGFWWRHLETCWRPPETYQKVCDIQWYLLDSAGDTWRPAGDIQTHTTRFTTSNDTSWIPLETPGDSLEPSQDICRHSLHPMIPPGFCRRHLETCWRCPETCHEVGDIQWYLLPSAGDTWRLAGAFTRHMSMFTTSNDPSWIPLEMAGDFLETSRDVPQGSWHPLIPPGFCWRHLETCWRHRETYHKVHNIQWYLLDSTGDTWRHLETWWRHRETYHEVQDIQ